MSRQRLVRGDWREFDWRRTAAERGVPPKLADELFQQAVHLTGMRPRYLRSTYLQLLQAAADSRPTDSSTERPSPGKMSRTLRAGAPHASRGRRRSRPGVPGKRALTAHIETALAAAGRRSARVADSDAERRRLTGLVVTELFAALVLGPSEPVSIRVDGEARRRTGERDASGLMAGGTIFLHPDRYDPRTEAGLSLLGHELVHLAQYRRPGGDPVAETSAAAEREASTLATRFARGHRVRPPRVSLGARAMAADNAGRRLDDRARRRTTLDARTREQILLASGVARGLCEKLLERDPHFVHQTWSAYRLAPARTRDRGHPDFSHHLFAAALYRHEELTVKWLPSLVGKPAMSGVLWMRLTSGRTQKRAAAFRVWMSGRRTWEERKKTVAFLLGDSAHSSTLNPLLRPRGHAEQVPFYVDLMARAVPPTGVPKNLTEAQRIVDFWRVGIDALDHLHPALYYALIERRLRRLGLWQRVHENPGTVPDDPKIRRWLKYTQDRGMHAAWRRRMRAVIGQGSGNKGGLQKLLDQARTRTQQYVEAARGQNSARTRERAHSAAQSFDQARALIAKHRKVMTQQITSISTRYRRMVWLRKTMGGVTKLPKPSVWQRSFGGFIAGCRDFAWSLRETWKDPNVQTRVFAGLEILGALVSGGGTMVAKIGLWLAKLGPKVIAMVGSFGDIGKIVKSLGKGALDRLSRLFSPEGLLRAGARVFFGETPFSGSDRAKKGEKPKQSTRGAAPRQPRGKGIRPPRGFARVVRLVSSIGRRVQGIAGSLEGFFGRVAKKLDLRQKPWFRTLAKWVRRFLRVGAAAAAVKRLAAAVPGLPGKLRSRIKAFFTGARKRLGGMVKKVGQVLTRLRNPAGLIRQVSDGLLAAAIGFIVNNPPSSVLKLAVQGVKGLTGKDPGPWLLTSIRKLEVGGFAVGNYLLEKVRGWLERLPGIGRIAPFLRDARRAMGRFSKKTLTTLGRVEGRVLGMLGKTEDVIYNFLGIKKTAADKTKSADKSADKKATATKTPGPRRSATSAGPVAVDEDSERALESSHGRPLPEETRRDMEERFGYDFSGVRIHTDSAAGRAARQLEANALAQGGDIYFAAGRFAPASSAGRQLLAHELTHVVQQGAARPLAADGPHAPLREAPAVRASRVTSAPGDAAEREAEMWAERAVASGPGLGGVRPSAIGRARPHRSGAQDAFSQEFQQGTASFAGAIEEWDQLVGRTAVTSRGEKALTKFAQTLIATGFDSHYSAFVLPLVRDHTAMAGALDGVIQTIGEANLRQAKLDHLVLMRDEFLGGAEIVKDEQSMKIGERGWRIFNYLCGISSVLRLFVRTHSGRSGKKLLMAFQRTSVVADLQNANKAIAAAARYEPDVKLSTDVLWFGNRVASSDIKLSGGKIEIKGKTCAAAWSEGRLSDALINELMTTYKWTPQAVGQMARGLAGATMAATLRDLARRYDTPVARPLQVVNSLAALGFEGITLVKWTSRTHGGEEFLGPSKVQTICKHLKDNANLATLVKSLTSRRRKLLFEGITDTEFTHLAGVELDTIRACLQLGMTGKNIVKIDKAKVPLSDLQAMAAWLGDRRLVDLVTAHTDSTLKSGLADVNTSDRTRQTKNRTNIDTFGAAAMAHYGAAWLAAFRGVTATTRTHVVDRSPPVKNGEISGCHDYSQFVALSTVRGVDKSRTTYSIAIDNSGRTADRSCGLGDIWDLTYRLQEPGGTAGPDKRKTVMKDLDSNWTAWSNAANLAAIDSVKNRNYPKVGEGRWSGQAQNTKFEGYGLPNEVTTFWVAS